MSADARLWGGSLSVALTLHLAVGVAAILWLNPPITDLPAGTFAVELADFGGAQGAPGGGGSPAATTAPLPPVKPQTVEPSLPPKPVEAEVALPQPKPIPKPPPKPHPVAKPAPKPPVQPAEAARPATEAPAAPVAEVPAQSIGAGGAPGSAAGSGTGGEGAVGSPISGRLGAGGVGAGTPLGRYKALVYHALWQKRSYPAVAQRMGYEGEVEIAFTVAADGDIADVHVTRESGHGVLDREAAALLGRVRRFPPIPAELGARSLTFRIVIPFKLS